MPPIVKNSNSSNWHLRVSWLARVIKMELAYNVVTTILQVLVRFPCILIWSISFAVYQIFKLTTFYPRGLDLFDHILLPLEIHWWGCWRASSQDAILAVRFQKADMEDWVEFARQRGEFDPIGIRATYIFDFEFAP